MAKRLLIVESPTKAKTINRYVGKEFVVKATVGHVKDLPKSRMGVDVEKDFAVELEVIHGKKKVITELCKAAKTAKDILLAPDPDREGEAIAWHISEELMPINPNIQRVTFNEITRRAVQEAMNHPRPLDRSLYDAQQARRVLDRLVGYQWSPLLWEKVRRGLSAGRVQSVAVRLIVEREKEIEAFVPVEYWSIEEILKTLESEKKLTAQLAKVNGKKLELSSQPESDRVREELQKAEHHVSSVEHQDRLRRPGAPFITSKLQQAGAAALKYSAKKTMRIAQQLYEGVEVEGEGSVGLITYMRTDSTRVAADAIEAVRTFVGKTYGDGYVPQSPNVYKSKKDSQDAHEAIRPTDVNLTPDALKESLTPDQYKVYGLIWRQFVASQMTPARYDRTTISIAAGPYELRSTGSICTFPGWLAVAEESKEEDEGVELPKVSVGEVLQLEEVKTAQHFTQPPPRFNEGTLVKELEERGIGRPSTYASILDTIQSKGYVEKQEGRLIPTVLGKMVTELLMESFPEIMDIDFTAAMEVKLDEVEEGKADWVNLIKEFYGPFAKTMEKARINMRDVKREEISTEHVCELCGSPMVIKWGRNGYFLACSGYPKCKNTKEVKISNGNQVEILPQEETQEVCGKCGRPMVIKRGRWGRFLACTGYPECKSTRSVSIGVQCPECKEGHMVEKRSRRGKVFYSCGRYPDCKFSTWYEPVAEQCPECGFPILVRKESQRNGRWLTCPSKDCGFKREADSESN
jgi:DNA topoisomerase I